MWFYLTVAGAILLVVLAVIAIVMWIKVFQQNAKRRALLVEQEREANEKIEQHRNKLHKDIAVVAQAFLNDELSSTETAMRLAYAMDQLGVDAISYPQFSVIFQLRDKTKHIPILAKWRALSVKEQRAFDKERLGIEAEHYEAMQAAIHLIKTFRF
ncbi:MAG: DUF2489 domain-containing protein [Cellvibrio sp.]